MAEFLSFGLNGPLGAVPGLLAVTFVPLPDGDWKKFVLSIVAGSTTLSMLGGTGLNLKTAVVTYEAHVLLGIVLTGVFLYKGFSNMYEKSTKPNEK